MTMDVRMHCEEPGEIRYTLKITMTAKAWDALRDQLDGVHNGWLAPAGDLRRHITDLLAQARKTYYPSPENEP